MHVISCCCSIHRMLHFFFLTRKHVTPVVHLGKIENPLPKFKLPEESTVVDNIKISLTLCDCCFIFQVKHDV